MSFGTPSGIRAALARLSNGPLASLSSHTGESCTKLGDDMHRDQENVDAPKTTLAACANASISCTPAQTADMNAELQSYLTDQQDILAAACQGACSGLVTADLCRKAGYSYG